MIFDHTERILYAGDELDVDQVLLLPGFAEKAGQFHSEPAGDRERLPEIVDQA